METVHVFPDPLTIVPSDTDPADVIVVPTVKAGDPVVVKVVPVQLAVGKDRVVAEPQLII